MTDKTFYLFGSDACRTYRQEGFGQLKAVIETEDLGYSIFCFEQNLTSSASLLDAYDGWGDYEVLTEEEYDELSYI